MLFHLDFRVEYSAEMSQNDLFEIWSEEATAAVGAKKAGVASSDHMSKRSFCDISAEYSTRKSK